LVSRGFGRGTPFGFEEQGFLKVPVSEVSLIFMWVAEYVEME